MPGTTCGLAACVLVWFQSQSNRDGTASTDPCAPVAHRPRQRVCHRLGHVQDAQAGGVRLGPGPRAAEHRDAAPLAGRQQSHLRVCICVWGFGGEGGGGGTAAQPVSLLTGRGTGNGIGRGISNRCRPRCVKAALQAERGGRPVALAAAADLCSADDIPQRPFGKRLCQKTLLGT